MNKKGQGISMTYIIVALLAMVVLVVIILFFTGGMKKIFGQTATAGEVTDQQISLWRKECELLCSVDEKAFCEKSFKVKNEKGEVTGYYTCNTLSTASGTGTKNDLGVVCAGITSCPEAKGTTIK